MQNTDGNGIWRRRCTAATEEVKHRSWASISENPNK